MGGILLCIAVSGAGTGAAALEYSGPAVVLAGDTLELGDESVRLHGIDAPGVAQRCRRAGGIEWRCGLLARTELVRHIGDRPVTCRDEGRNEFGQRVASCRVEGAVLSAWLVERGWALAADAALAETESAARAAGRGLWHDGFEPSADWRLEAAFPHRTEDERAATVCPCTARHKRFTQRRQP